MAVGDLVRAGGRDPGRHRLEIRVLGPVEVAWDGRTIDIGGVKARALVARLLVDRQLIVSVDRLVDSLWDDHDGDGAEIALRSTISRVRKRLRDAGAPDSLIVTRAPGYALDVAAEMTDVSRFENLVAEGRQQLARRRPSEATRLLVEAQELWRGSAYSEVRDEPFARAEARRLEELLLTAVETRMDAGLTSGRHQALAGELETLTSANPMRERLWSQRMLALYRSGRQAEALRVFQDLRTILVDELGIEPGHDVTWMERAILVQDPALDFRVPPERGAEEPPRDAPATPTAPTYRVRVPAAQHEGPFVGREREAALLSEWWSSVRGGEGRLLLVDGDPGVGKTRLVVDLVSTVAADGALVLWGRCDEDPVAPFQPFAEALGRYFQSLSADVISRMPGWQLAELARLVVRMREYAPPEQEHGDPESDRFRFFEAVAATCNELSGDGSVLLVIDDLHWADQPSLLLLRHLLRSADDGKLGVIGIYIDTEVPSAHRLRSMVADWRAVHPVETVHLRGLRPDAVEELAQAWLDTPADLVPQLCRLTDGNPLFLDELLRQIRYRQDEQGAEGDAPVPPNLNPPEAIRELVARRVSRLPEDVIYLLQAAAVAGAQWESAIVAEAAELTPDRRLDAIDRAEESRLVRRVGPQEHDRYAFSHALVRDAIYGELLRGRRVRYHHKIAVATEHAHGDALDAYCNELAHHFYMGAALADADKAMRYCRAAGEQALRLLAFEEAVGHFTRGLELTEHYGPRDPTARCDALLALADAQNRSGDAAQADANFAKAASLARGLHDPERLATAAVQAGPLSYLGIVEASDPQVQLLEEARATLPEKDSYVRAMVLARLGLVTIYSSDIVASEVQQRSLAFNETAVAMARRLGDRHALGYALNARMHALWGIGPASERMAIGTELGEIAEDTGDELLALHGHMWRVRELVAQGDLEAVKLETARFEARETGPVHPLDAAFGFNVGAMLALLAGDFETAERLGRTAMDASGGFNDLAATHYAALMLWTWWQRDELVQLQHQLRDAIAQAPAAYPGVNAALALADSEANETETALKYLDVLSEIGWGSAADQSEGVTLAMAAAACGTIGEPARRFVPSIYEALRPYAGTAVVIRAPAAACLGPADHYLGLLAGATGDLALAEVHLEAALRLAWRMDSPPFVAAAEADLARTLRQRARVGEEERIAVLLRSSEESARRMGLSRVARLAAEPG
jgi:DNA-binding SARP family transcriptional activator